MQGNYTHPNRPAIRDIDYAKLAKIADNHRVSFVTLCKRAEKGQPLDYMNTNSPDWVDYNEAADIMSITYASLASAFTNDTSTIEYYGVGWKTKSKTKPKGKRGCGVLFRRADLIIVVNIKKSANLSLGAALRVFQAMKMGEI